MSATNIPPSTVTAPPLTKPAELRRDARNDEWYFRAKKPLIALNDADDGSRMPLFFLPSLPAASTDYLVLAELFEEIAPNQTIFALRAPHEFRRERKSQYNAGIDDFTHSVEKMAGYYVKHIHEIRPEGPIAFAAWSAGVPIALVAARILKEEYNRDISLLAAIDFAPFNVHVNPLEKAKGLYHRVSNKLTKLSHSTAGQQATSTVQQAAGMDQTAPNPDPYVGKIGKLLRLAELVRKEVHSRYSTHGLSEIAKKIRRHPVAWHFDLSKQPEGHYRFFMAMYDLVANFSHKGPPHSKNIIVYEAMEQPERTHLKVAKTWRRFAPWATIVPLEGSHSTITQNKSVARFLVEHLNEELERASAPRASASPGVLAYR